MHSVGNYIADVVWRPFLVNELWIQGEICGNYMHLSQDFIRIKNFFLKRVYLVIGKTVVVCTFEKKNLKASRSLKKIHLVANFGEKLLIFWEIAKRVSYYRYCKKRDSHLWIIFLCSLTQFYQSQEKLLPLTLHVPVLILFLKH